MDEQPGEVPGASGVTGRGEVPEVLGGSGDSGLDDVAELPGLPLLPGFREMALRRMSAERRRLVADLTAQRRSSGLSQTEVAARMGTSQSAVARLETGDADVRVSTLERYAAAIGSQVAWQARPGRTQPGEEHPGLERAGLGHPGQAHSDLTQPEPPQAGSSQAAPQRAALEQEYR